MLGIVDINRSYTLTFDFIVNGEMVNQYNILVDHEEHLEMRRAASTSKYVQILTTNKVFSIQ